MKKFTFIVYLLIIYKLGINSSSNLHCWGLNFEYYDKFSDLHVQKAHKQPKYGCDQRRSKSSANGSNNS